MFAPEKPVHVHAIVVGQSINTKMLEKTAFLASSPLVIQAGANGYAALFRYGTAVLFNLNPLEETRFLEDLRNVVTEPFENTEHERIYLRITAEQPARPVIGDTIILKECTLEHIQLIAIALAKSAYLSYYESQVAKVFDRIEPLGAELQRKGRTGHKARELLSHIGQSLLIQGKMVGHAEVGEKPDLLWERPDLDQFYAQLGSEFELEPRLIILKHKLDLVHKTSETILDLLQNSRSLHVEWYIVFLILFEILLSLYEKFSG